MAHWSMLGSAQVAGGFLVVQQRHFQLLISLPESILFVRSVLCRRQLRKTAEDTGVCCGICHATYKPTAMVPFLSP